MTWQTESPKLWQAVTEGYGAGWWDKTLEEINEIEDTRAQANLCVFCGKPLIECKEVTVVEPPRPWAGPFCSPTCANNQLLFYCMREGK